MSKPKVVVTEREVRLARAFMHAIGANEKSGYLLLAVITWLRAMGKAHDKFWKSLAHLSAMSAGKALAARLKAQSKAHPAQYRSVLADLRDKTANADQQAAAAKLFLTNISKSSWDAKHYGYVAAVAGKWVYKNVGNPNLPPGDQVWQWVWESTDEVNPLQTAWASLTGHPIPPQWFNDPITVTKPVTEKPVPPQPRSLQHVLPKPDFILPYATLHFYEQRPHLGANVLPTD